MYSSHSAFENLPDLSTEPLDPGMEGAVNVWTRSGINGIVYDRENLDEMSDGEIASLLAHEAVHVTQDIDIRSLESRRQAEHEAGSIEVVVLDSMLRGECGHLKSDHYIAIMMRRTFMAEWSGRMKPPNTPDFLGLGPEQLL